ncbi:hypothetical protein [Clostridium sp. UBA871]|uniref:hypothetical protein n=1 Tax=Clostridium sp. UBA871 TaxID=1946380 RepID=UPI003217199D
MKKIFSEISLLLIILNIFNTLLGVKLKPVYAATANNPPIINIESPTNNLSGVVTIKGYVLSDYDPSTFGLMTSSVYIDGALDKSMFFNLTTSISREDLKKKYPNYKYAGTGGFSYKLDTGKLSNGNHKIRFKFNEKIQKEIVISVKNNPPIINIESPTNNLSGVVTIQGYILSDYNPSTFGVMTSWVYIDGAITNSWDNLKTSISRDDLKKKYPDYKYAGTGGFSYNLDTTKLSNGNHKIKFKFNEIEKEILISVKNNPPIINIELPINTENLSGIVTIKGYVLSEYEDLDKKYSKRVYVDNGLNGSIHNLISRDDIKKRYPNYKYAEKSGFSYNLDTTQLSNGKHKIKFDFNGIEKELDISVNNNKPPIINIESPTNLENLSGNIKICGYILSDFDLFIGGNLGKNIYLDGKNYYEGKLEGSIRREDLKKKYPNYKYAGTGGFSYNIDTTKLSNGKHKIKFNFDGIEKELDISVNNNNAPIINIESPTNLENLNGVVTIKGYILSEHNPSTFGFMTSSVYIDGALADSMGNLKTSISREDLKNKYPDYKYAGTGGFNYNLDTTKLLNGSHKVKFNFNGVEKEIEIHTKNNPSIINIESPTNLENLSGVVTIQGCVLSDYDPSTFGFMTSTVYIDGALADSMFNLKTSISREDLKKKYPNYKYAGNGGFSYKLDTVKLKSGKHKLKFDINGITKEIDISVSNYKQELVIDKIDSLKAQEGFMKLTGYIVSAYDNVSDFDYNIYIDDVKVNDYIFDFHCNLPREDLKDKYPYCKNVTKGGFKYILDTRTLKNGNHKIRIKFKDTESSIDFKVDNSNYNNSLDISDDVTFEERMKRSSIGLGEEFIEQMDEAMHQMTEGINRAVEGMAQMNEAINKMNAAVNQMNSGVDDINNFLSISIDTLNAINKALDKTNAEMAKLKLARNSGNARDIDWSDFDLKIKEYNDLSGKVRQSIMDKTMNYLADSIKHMIGGKYTDSINTLGVAGDFVIGFFGADLPADIRDLSHDFKYWQWSWGHAAETTLDGIGLVPVIGVIKYGDEVGLIVKDAEKGVETIKLKGGIKGAAEANKVLEGLQGFKKGITAAQIKAINKGFGGTTELNGSIDTILDSASRYDGFWNKTAAITRSIVKNHTFDNGNKRTAQAVIETLMSRNGISTGVSESAMKDVIYKISTGQLNEIEDIAKALRGF